MLLTAIVFRHRDWGALIDFAIIVYGELLILLNSDRFSLTTSDAMPPCFDKWCQRFLSLVVLLGSGVVLRFDAFLRLQSLLFG